MARKDLWRWLWVFFVLLLGFPAYLQGGGGVNGRRTTSLHNAGDSRPTRDILSKPPLPICQVYQGRTCEAFLMNQTVFVTPGVTIDTIEERLKAAYGVIKESKDMNPNCRVYALPSLCYSILPTCRSPELSNHQYFAAKATYEANQRNNQRNSHKRKRLPLSATKRPPPATTPKLTVYFSGPVTPAVDAEELQLVTAAAVSDRLRRRRETFDVTVDARTKAIKRIKDSGGGPRVSEYTSRQYPPTRNTENLRRICRDECELLENELCQKEYAIAKRHPAIGKLLQLEECTDLPDDSDCMSLGIAVDVAPEETCFWENGEKYRGTVATSASGRPCLKWARLMKEIADFPELAGQNFCRNPGGMHPEPWCFVENISVDKVIESCSIPRCSERMWLYVIISFVSLAMGILCVVCLVCCKKWRKRGMTNIQNINLPSADKNIYGNSRLNSPMEMASLLPNVSGGVPGGPVGIPAPPHQRPPAARGASVMRVPQYTLQDVRFVEELGEGAFGKVYKGELTQANGEKIFVAVKALKENASAKTQGDFKREIELISDLKHDNIVCILGVVLKEEPLCMLFEYMTQGDLHEFLISNSPNEGKNLTQVQFLSIAMQICDGMEYLAGHHYVHRDLAARNCLVGDALTVKISDFGLSRDIYSSDYYRVQSKSLLPVRWMPSESILYGKFTTESDVWSFGVVLWEIYSYGLQPYYGYSNQEVISMVRARQLLPCPEACPSPVYSLMVECWHEQAVRRPSFPEIGHRLKIWYQARKRNEQAENASNFGGSRKGSTFSISASNRGQVVTPSSSSQHSLGRADAEQGPPKERSNSTSGNMASLERGHHHHHHHHHQSLERDREGSFSHHHHHSKSRLSNASNSNLSIGGTPGTTFASDEHLHEPQRRQKGTKEKHHHHHHRQRLNSGTDSTERSRKSDPDVEIPQGRKSSVASVKSADRDAVLMISPSKRLPPPYPQF
ncbi:tyrosine-protein kinase transmembrane receptor Ror-like [Lutzomyia longipalpis]|nr:tyrosine-protein kinase transmembrane receptor Ror-like [Lutzomyia longipalpis]